MRFGFHARQQLPEFIQGLPELSTGGVDVVTLLAAECGRDAFVLKASDHVLDDAEIEALVSAVKTVAEGGSIVKPAVTQRLLKGLENLQNEFSSLDQPDPLTDRETEILRLMAGGYSNKEIANSLGVAEGTVKNHVSNILSKMGVRDRTRAVLKAFEMSLL